MSSPPRDPMVEAKKTVQNDREAQIEGRRQGQPSLFTCPDCSGTLWQVNEPDLLTFRCHVGHVVTAEKLLEDQTQAAENALWIVIRTLTDNMVLGQQIARVARLRGDHDAAARIDAQARASGDRAGTLRNIAEEPADAG